RTYSGKVMEEKGEMVRVARSAKNHCTHWVTLSPDLFTANSCRSFRKSAPETNSRIPRSFNRWPATSSANRGSQRGIVDGKAGVRSEERRGVEEWESWGTR